MHAPMRCYRHPDRETYVSCSECGRPICAECMTPAPVERYLGRFRYLLVYLVSGLAGSAGALLVTPNSPTVGASGAIFGIMGAALVLERQGAYVLGGQAIGIILINLVFSFTFAGISIGGHIGGLIGGALCMLALTRFGRDP